MGIYLIVIMAVSETTYEVANIDFNIKVVWELRGKAVNSQKVVVFK